MSDVKPLSAEEEAEVRSHHEPSHYPATATEPEWTQCSWSTGPDEWPCDEARLLATLDAERSARVPAPAEGLDVERLAKAMAEESASRDGTGLGWATLSGWTDARPMAHERRRPRPRVRRPRRVPAMTPEEARAVMAARTEGPWEAATEGSHDQLHAAAKAFQAVMATTAKDNPNIQYSDLSWVRAGWPNVAMVGNGPNGPENARAIALAVNTWDALMDVADAARELLAEPFDLDTLREALDTLDARLEAER